MQKIRVKGFCKIHRTFLQFAKNLKPHSRYTQLAFQKPVDFIIYFFKSPANPIILSYNRKSFKSHSANQLFVKPPIFQRFFKTFLQAAHSFKNAFKIISKAYASSR